MNTNTAPAILPDCDLAHLATPELAALPADNDTCPDPIEPPGLPVLASAPEPREDAPRREVRMIPDPRAVGYGVTDTGAIVKYLGGPVTVEVRPSWVRTKRGEGQRYLRVAIPQPDGSTWYARVHTLVAMAWHGPRPEGAIARHLSDDRSDNRPANIAWGTYTDNLREAYDNGRRRTALTAELVRILREAHARIGGTAEETIEAVEAVHGPLPCSLSAATAAITGRTWTHLPMPATPAEDVRGSDDTPATLSHAASAVPAWVA